jgi:tetratricopeptide (TPR) repeat protein
VKLPTERQRLLQEHWTVVMGRQSSVAMFRQAFLLHQQNKLAEAEELYLTVLQLDPVSTEAHHNLGTLLVQLNRWEEAIPHFEKAIAIRPDSPEAHNNLGNVLVRLNRLNESIVQFEKALEVSQRNAEPYLRTCYNIGASLQALNRHEEAIAHYARAIAIKPDYAQAHNNLGDALMKCERPEEALTHYERSVDIKPDVAEAQNRLGVCLHALNRENSAIAHFTKALVIRPDYADAHANLGLALESLGRLEEATRAFEKAIEHAPTVAKFYRWLFRSKKAVAGDPRVTALIALAQRKASLPRVERIELHFGLGKVFADLKQFDQSFRHLLEGNALKRQEIVYDEGAMVRRLDRIRTVFSPEFMRSKQGVGNRSAEPVFILGMPRSGSTLIEQILASHPRVFGAGELDYFNRAATLIAGQHGARPQFLEQIRMLADEELVRLGSRYLCMIRNIAPDAERVTDKAPSNFLLAGLIHLALPNARIIHARRDPVDTCVSCFATLFARGQPFAYELGELGRYYRAYERLMDHWRAVLPEGVMLEVRYEELVADFEGHARRIIDHCGLAWDAACLAFYKTQRPVKTASAPQVYQPLYNTSVGRGSCYGDLLQPLFDALA